MSMLFSPKFIGAMEVRNRIVMPAMTTRLANEDGTVSDATIAYFAARAAGGTGLVTVEMASPERVGRHRFRELGIYDDRFVPGLQRLTESIHAHGAKASIQLGHAGGHTRQDICGETPIAPWALPHYVFEVTGATVTPLMMTRERIEQTVRAFVAAALRARAANFDCVEVHAAHGYLLSQFLCPAENYRRDEYGRSIENRARLTLQIVRRIQSEVRGFPIILRLNANDYFPGGLRFGDSLKVAKWAVEAGVSALHVTAGHYRSLPSAHMMTPPMNCAEGIFLEYAARIKEEVTVPVIAVGRLGDPETGHACGRKRSGGFRRARTSAHRRSGLGRESATQCTRPPLSVLQRVCRRHARRRSIALCRESRGGSGARVCAVGARRERRAHRGDRRGAGGAVVCGRSSRDRTT